jgi:hypothetical protein
LELNYFRRGADNSLSFKTCSSGGGDEGIIIYGSVSGMMKMKE